MAKLLPILTKFRFVDLIRSLSSRTLFLSCLLRSTSLFFSYFESIGRLFLSLCFFSYYLISLFISANNFWCESPLKGLKLESFYEVWLITVVAVLAVTILLLLPNAPPRWLLMLFAIICPNLCLIYAFVSFDCLLFSCLSKRRTRTEGDSLLPSLTSRVLFWRESSFSEIIKWFIYFISFISLNLIL